MNDVVERLKRAKERIVKTWKNMVQRCTNSNSPDYKNYGGRGITICVEWTNVNAFIDWAIASGYTHGLSIDRIDVNGNYEPLNCRWATPSQQGANRRKQSRAKRSVFKGVSRSNGRGKWRVSMLRGHARYFTYELEAALAYDDAATDAYGEFARVNFPERIRAIAHYRELAKEKAPQ